MGTYRSKIVILILLIISFVTYSILLYESDSKQSAPPNKLAQKGRVLWQEKNCTACHQLYGLGGHLGPDLTNVYERRSEDYIKSILHTGTVVMPDFKLNEQEIEEFVEFFKYINSTGNADPKSYKKHLDGTISQ
ncbi:MAG: cytochrome c [Bacteroidetes bacterium]|nr:cytochrome c [Bacteroidota bacterium]